MKVSDFSFKLPEAAIAQYPITPRDSAKLLCVSNLKLDDKHVYDLPSLLREGDVLVCNDTKVLPSRLKGRRGGVKVEVTLHKNVSSDCWKAFAKPARKLSVGDVFTVSDDFFATVIAKYQGEVELKFSCADSKLLLALHEHGELPLPPYIARKQGNIEEDNDRYQTVFAQKEGAVAAPTAGLHFTPELLFKLKEKGIQQEFLTLHVGAGTFLPMKVENTKDHVMHSEYGVLTEEVAMRLNKAKQEGRRIVAVGTTSMRLLESAADECGMLYSFTGETDIFITEGYQFKAVDALITNFHLPESTLFMLVCAFAGVETMKAAYQYAINTGYRFYSYGDASMIVRMK